MRASIILLIIIAFLEVQCQQDSRRANLEGTYVSQIKGEYALNYDTLLITSLKSDVKSYSITSKTGFQKIRNGKLLEKEHKKNSWIASWDENKNILVESGTGTILRYNPNDKSILWNKLVFSKSN